MPEYVYAIVESSAPTPDRPGIAGRPLRAIRTPDAAALVSSIDAEELTLGRAELLAHNEVLQAALETGPVLPMRLGTVMADDDDIRRRILDSNAAELHAQLTRLAGTFEGEVRAVYDEAALLREAVQRDPHIARLRARGDLRRSRNGYLESVTLGEAVADAVERIRQSDADMLLAELTPHCLEVRVSPPVHERIALRAAFLLDRDHSSEFDDALESVARSQAGRIHFRYTAPLAPHSFVALGGAA